MSDTKIFVDETSGKKIVLHKKAILPLVFAVYCDICEEIRDLGGHSKIDLGRLLSRWKRIVHEPFENTYGKPRNGAKNRLGALDVDVDFDDYDYNDFSAPLLGTTFDVRLTFPCGGRHVSMTCPLCCARTSLSYLAYVDDRARYLLNFSSKVEYGRTLAVERQNALQSTGSVHVPYRREAFDPRLVDFYEASGTSVCIVTVRMEGLVESNGLREDLFTQVFACTSTTLNDRLKGLFSNCSLQERDYLTSVRLDIGVAVLDGTGTSNASIVDEIAGNERMERLLRICGEDVLYYDDFCTSDPESVKEARVVYEAFFPDAFQSFDAYEHHMLQFFAEGDEVTVTL